MAIQRYIENTPIFTSNQLFAAEGFSQTNKNLLSRALKTGKVLSPKKGVYVSNTGRYRAAEINPLLIAEYLVEDVVFAYDTALDTYVGLQNVSSVISAFGNTTKKYNFLGLNYSFYKPAKQKYCTPLLIDNRYMLRRTSLEQTIVDCLENPSRSGGLEQVLRGFAFLTNVNLAKLEQILKASPLSTQAKCGWLLALKCHDWEVPSQLLDNLKQTVRKGPHYFVNKTKRANFYDSAWALYAPYEFTQMQEWLKG